MAAGQSNRLARGAHGRICAITVAKSLLRRTHAAIARHREAGYAPTDDPAPGMGFCAMAKRLPSAKAACANIGQPGMVAGDIAGTVATMTECERVPRVKEPPTAPRVNRDSVTRWARRLVVQSDVGELSFALRSVRNREAVPSPHHFLWHHGCFGWRVQVQITSQGTGFS